MSCPSRYRLNQGVVSIMVSYQSRCRINQGVASIIVLYQSRCRINQGILSIKASVPASVGTMRSGSRLPSARSCVMCLPNSALSRCFSRVMMVKKKKGNKGGRHPTPYDRLKRGSCLPLFFYVCGCFWVRLAETIASFFFLGGVGVLEALCFAGIIPEKSARQL